MDQSKHYFHMLLNRLIVHGLHFIFYTLTSTTLLLFLFCWARVFLVLIFTFLISSSYILPTTILHFLYISYTCNSSLRQTQAKLLRIAVHHNNPHQQWHHQETRLSIQSKCALIICPLLQLKVLLYSNAYTMSHVPDKDTES